MALGGVDDVGPSAVVEGHLEQEAVVVGRLGLGAIDDGGDVGG